MLVFAVSLIGFSVWAQGPAANTSIVLRPARVFDGEAVHQGWSVRVKGNRIESAGPSANIDSSGARVVDLPGLTVMPGLIEGHSHVLLHPYNETVWNDQVAKEGLALRAARAVNHLRATLMAGFTTIRDLGTEGAGYSDVEDPKTWTKPWTVQIDMGKTDDRRQMIFDSACHEGNYGMTGILVGARREEQAAKK